MKLYLLMAALCLVTWRGVAAPEEGKQEIKAAFGVELGQAPKSAMMDKPLKEGDWSAVFKPVEPIPQLKYYGCCFTAKTRRVYKIECSSRFSSKEDAEAAYQAILSAITEKYGTPVKGSEGGWLLGTNYVQITQDKRYVRLTRPSVNFLDGALDMHIVYVDTELEKQAEQERPKPTPVPKATPKPGGL